MKDIVQAVYLLQMVETREGKILRVLAVADICTAFTYEDIEGFRELNGKYHFQGKFIVSKR